MNAFNDHFNVTSDPNSISTGTPSAISKGETNNDLARPQNGEKTNLLSFDRAGIKHYQDELLRDLNDDPSSDLGVQAHEDIAIPEHRKPILFPEFFDPEDEDQLYKAANLSDTNTDRRTFWICADNSPDGTSLSKCRACRSEKKYSSFRNAATHLRRSHFRLSRQMRKRGLIDKICRGSENRADTTLAEPLRAWTKEVTQEVPSP